MEARQPISGAENYEVDKSSSQRIIMVIVLPSCIRRIHLIEMSGLAVSKTDQVLPSTTKESQFANTGHLEDDEDVPDDEARAEPVMILKEEARFQDITAWGHDRLTAADDNFVKGIEEWIAFAEAVCISP